MKKISIFFLFVLSLAVAQAQTVIVGQSVSPQTGCGLTVYDIGGESGDYFANRDDHVVLQSNDATHPAVKVDIPLNFFNVHNSDTVFIYDGPNMVDSMLLATLNDSLVAVYGNVVLSFAATMRSQTGELTIRFKTDGSNNGAGFKMLTSCVRLCQRVEIQFDVNASNHFPILQPDSGYYYMQLCPYDTVHLVARGRYPDNDFNYHQSDQTSRFRWDLGDTTIETIGGNVLNHYFPGGNAFDVTLLIVDAQGCEASMSRTFRVMTSMSPIRGITPLPPVCTGDEVSLSFGYDMISNIQLDTISSARATALGVPDTIFLPDGQDCGTGCAYTSSVTFDMFSPSAKISSVNDILYVRINMEHSYMGDIWIKLTCPNGQYATIMKFNGTRNSDCSNTSIIPASDAGWVVSGVNYDFFGLPRDGGSNDNTSNKCDPVTNPMGTCWNYCWSNNVTEGYQYASGNGYVYESVNHHSTSSINPYGSGSSADSTDVANMTQVYRPDDNFYTKLQNCPLNGDWSIQVVDGFSVDNGWICGWEMALNPSLLPTNWGFDLTVDTAYLIGPGAAEGVVVPADSGNITYIARIVDEFGCQYDTNMVMRVTQSPEPNLGEDRTECYGQRITLNPGYEAPNTTYVWSTGDDSPTTSVVTAGQYTVYVETTDPQTGTTCHGSDTINLQFYEMPFFNFDANVVQGCAPLVLKFSNNSTPENAVYNWQIMNENAIAVLSSNQKEPVFQIEDPGTYSVSLVSTTENGCSDTVIRWNYLKVNSQPVAEFTADPEISLMGEHNGEVHFICYSDSVLMLSDGCHFVWNFGDGESDTTEVSPNHIYSQWGDYPVTLRIETGDGCASEITHTVVIEQDLIFPNVITPNGDGTNDVFAIENLNTDVNPEDPDGYRNNKLVIFDRWGKKVYEAKNYDTFARDGQIQLGSQVFDASGVSDGVYYFSFYYKGKAKTVNYNGSLTIIR